MEVPVAKIQEIIPEASGPGLAEVLHGDCTEEKPEGTTALKKEESAEVA